jgi:hypothetical protein
MFNIENFRDFPMRRHPNSAAAPSQQMVFPAKIGWADFPETSAGDIFKARHFVWIYVDFGCFLCGFMMIYDWCLKKLREPSEFPFTPKIQQGPSAESLDRKSRVRGRVFGYTGAWGP